MSEEDNINDESGDQFIDNDNEGENFDLGESNNTVVNNTGNIKQENVEDKPNNVITNTTLNPNVNPIQNTDTPNPNIPNINPPNLNIPNTNIDIKMPMEKQIPPGVLVGGPPRGVMMNNIPIPINFPHQIPGWRPGMPNIPMMLTRGNMPIPNMMTNRGIPIGTPMRQFSEVGNQPPPQIETKRETRKSSKKKNNNNNNEDDSDSMNSFDEDGDNDNDDDSDYDDEKERKKKKASIAENKININPQSSFSFDPSIQQGSINPNMGGNVSQQGNIHPQPMMGHPPNMIPHHMMEGMKTGMYPINPQFMDPQRFYAMSGGGMVNPQINPNIKPNENMFELDMNFQKLVQAYPPADTLIEKLPSSKTPVIDAFIYCSICNWGVSISADKSPSSFVITDFNKYWEYSQKICSKPSPTETPVARLKALRRWFADFPGIKKIKAVKEGKEPIMIKVKQDRLTDLINILKKYSSIITTRCRSVMQNLPPPQMNPPPQYMHSSNPMNENQNFS